MKIAYYSDLHLEFKDWIPPQTDADVVVLAGDIHVGDGAIEWAQRHFNQPVIYVLGNHEYYCNGNMQALQDALIIATKGTNIHVLLGDAIVINGVNFIGSTLWTDFNIGDNPQLSMTMAKQMINDYKLISVDTVRNDDRKFTPLDADLLHHLALLQIKNAIKPNMPNIVVSHFGVDQRCSHEQFRGDDLSGAFNSDLTDFISVHKKHFSTWIYGHTHHNHDFEICGVPIITNQRGYAPHDLTPGFKPNKTLTVRIGHAD